MGRVRKTRRWPPFLVVVCIICLSGADFRHAHATGAKPDCEIDKNPCSILVDGHEVVLDITPKPVKAMRELNFIVVIRGKTGKGELRLDLSMPYMYMGKNQIVLKGDDTGRYTGKGIITRCTSGRRLWKATVNIPDAGTAEFLFNVTY